MFYDGEAGLVWCFSVSFENKNVFLVVVLVHEVEEFGVKLWQKNLLLFFFPSCLFFSFPFCS